MQKVLAMQNLIKSKRKILFVLIPILSLNGCAPLPTQGYAPGAGVSTNSVEYIVKRGDTLGEIAQKMTGSSENWRKIAQYNRIKNPNSIEIGQRLLIPSGTESVVYNTNSVSQGESAPSSNSFGRATQEGAIVVGLLGGLAAAALGRKEDRGRNLLIGLAAGAVAGGLVGSIIDQRKQQYASLEDFYDGQIQQTSRLNQELSTSNRELRRTVQNKQAEVNRLIQQYRSGRATRSQLVAAKQSIDTDYSSKQQVLARLQQEIALNEEVLAEMSQTQNQKNRQKTQLKAETDRLKASMRDTQSLANDMGEYSAKLGRSL